MPRLLALWILALPAFAADPALTISGIAGHDGVASAPLQLSLEDIRAMPRTTVSAKTHDGKEHQFEGVLLAEILKKAGLPQGESVRGPMLTRYILATAHDGYRAIFSLPELDPAFSDTRALLVDKVDGQPLASRDGPLRIVIPSEKRETRWVRMLERIEILQAPEPVR